VVKHGDFSKKITPNKIFPIFGFKSRLSFQLAVLIFLRSYGSPSVAASSVSKVLKMEPLIPISTGLNFAYGSDVAKNNSCDPGHVVELSF
jgi:hypothetical protein